MVNFIIRQDKYNQFLFTPLQSETGKQLLIRHQLPLDNLDSFVLIDHDKAFLRSTAVLTVLKKLSFHWKWTQIFWIIPLFIRDRVYNLIARNRYKWFGKKESCMIPAPEVKARFLG